MRPIAVLLIFFLSSRFGFSDACAADSASPAPLAFGEDGLPAGLGIQAPDHVTVFRATVSPTGAAQEPLATVGGYTLSPSPRPREPASGDDYAPPSFFTVLAPSGAPGAQVTRALASCSCLKAEIVESGSDGKTPLIRVRRVHRPSGGDGFWLQAWLARPEGAVLQHSVAASPPGTEEWSMMEPYERGEERTGMQEHAAYRPETDLQTDFVMVYGLDADSPARIRQWRERGYIVHLMTGVAWGNYQDYLSGRFDGRPHGDEGQRRRDGSPIDHGPTVPYMVPSVAFADYLTENLKKAVDEGVEALHLEEPEFWAEAGYSEAFKREWVLYYNEDWTDPESSPDAQFRASRLKQYLYTRMLDRLCSSLKEYALVRHGRRLRFYVPTHSLLAYAGMHHIVSPGSKLLDLPCVDGYVAQVWTGTARHANLYGGALRERTFETAFLEYGVMQELVRGTGRRVWFLHDPVEDDPGHTWRDYRENYFRTVTASLLHPDVHHYEVTPWPHRVFAGQYPREDGGGREGIPAGYATTLLTLMHVLRDMKHGETRWRTANPEVGVLVSDSCMFQRQFPDGDPMRGLEGLEQDRHRFSGFFGLAMPLLKRGVAVRPVQLDNARRFAGYLDGHRTLALSYEFMKPEYPDLHQALAGWVRGGGVLVYVGDSSDAFHRVRHWWNTGGARYADPSDHLFEACGVSKEEAARGPARVGQGALLRLDVAPRRLALSEALAGDYLRLVAEALRARGLGMPETSAFVLERGPYVVAANLDESPFSKPHLLPGTYCDLYAPNLDVLTDPSVPVGGVGLFLDLAKAAAGPPDRGGRGAVFPLAVGGRVTGHAAGTGHCRFTVKGPSGIAASARLAAPRGPSSVRATDPGGANALLGWSHDAPSNTLLLRFASHPDGVEIALEF